MTKKKIKINTLNLNDWYAIDGLRKQDPQANISYQIQVEVS